ncbi:hypothetical protein [Mesobacillus harenae]|uniref:hypothetical protein n=1 Tax=Mesobacillus harenae TaxID=2213203 RepID=UPI001580DE47|nr:hypothetical protein [Mesobacillus harenae]
MDLGILILFGNAIMTTVLSAGIVIWILKKEYLPTIKKLEKEQDTAHVQNPDGIVKEV